MKASTTPTADHGQTANDLHTHVLDPLNAGDCLEKWQELAKNALEPNPFFGPDFLIPFLDEMGRRNVRLLAVSSATSGDWLLAAPVAPRKVGLTIPAATAWATEFGPLGAPLLAPGAPPFAVPTFLNLITRTTGLPLAAFPYIPLDGPAAAALGSAAGWRTISANEASRASHASGNEGEAQFAKAFSGKRRKELPRLIRRLSAQGEVKFESHRHDEAIRQFENFLQLEASGWKGKRGTALLSHHNSATFARQMISQRAAVDAVRLDAISVAERPIAMLVVLLEAGRAFSWKIAYDEAYARFSPGAQLTLFAFERNLRDPAISGADSLAVPGHPMIEPLWRGRMRYGTLLCAKSAPGRVMQTLGAKDLTLEQDLRRFARKILRRAS
ncbi:GNAT family N-acetyltransferase [Roseibium sp.]|uniref:GNAT family N-acetyltransferase n=1 Tax=Roseibium sp. TaxID=1936156 RepID=UPI003A97989F